MRVQINLASEPFRRDRSMFVASVVLSGVLTALLIVLIAITIVDRRSMAESQAELERMNAQVAKVDAQQRTLDAELRQAGNADVLERSEFINTLLYRKGISWTQLFSDLEKVLPPTVRIVSIRPQVDSRDHIFLDMVVGSETQKPVIDLLTRFEGSEVFGQISMSAVTPPSQTDPLYHYRLSVSYAQKL